MAWRVGPGLLNMELTTALNLANTQQQVTTTTKRYDPQLREYRGMPQNNKPNAMA